jgi:endonuclease G
MFVVTGPVLNAPIGRIGSNDVAVPRAFFKTLIAYKNGEVKGLGFVLNNEKSNKSLYTYIVSIDAIEKITGIDFYSKIETKIQEEAEANVDIKKWFIKK